MKKRDNTSDSLTILQVNSTDVGGGAARSGVDLHEAYRNRGHDAWLAVGYKRGDDPHTRLIRQDKTASALARPLWRAEAAVTQRGVSASRWLRYTLLAAAEPRRIADWFRGSEDFHFPGTTDLLEISGTEVDILHLHNLHGRYFDLRQLPRLTAQVPTVLTLHDAWLLSGHCAHSLDCERWREGCGHCPDLTLYPAILRDGTAENWQRKRDIYARSRYSLISPSQWLADKAGASPLQAGLLQLRVIPHGVNLAEFHPANQTEVRRELDLPLETQILVMVANDIVDSTWKGFSTAREAFAKLSTQQRDRPLLVLAIGSSTAEEKFGDVTIRYLPYQFSREKLARFYQAADLFLSASRAENFSLTILEALACGIPVVATAVGGTPEQVRSWPEAAADAANGILVNAGDADAMAGAIGRLLVDGRLRAQLGRNAARRAKAEFDFDTQVERYLAFYEEMLRTAGRDTGR